MFPICFSVQILRAMRVVFQTSKAKTGVGNNFTAKKVEGLRTTLAFIRESFANSLQCVFVDDVPIQLSNASHCHLTAMSVVDRFSACSADRESHHVSQTSCRSSK
jgi:hypothetical protein